MQTFTTTLMLFTAFSFGQKFEFTKSCPLHSAPSQFCIFWGFSHYLTKVNSTDNWIGCIPDINVMAPRELGWKSAQMWIQDVITRAQYLSLLLHVYYVVETLQYFHHCRNNTLEMYCFSSLRSISHPQRSLRNCSRKSVHFFSSLCSLCITSKTAFSSSSIPLFSPACNGKDIYVLEYHYTHKPHTAFLRWNKPVTTSGCAKSPAFTWKKCSTRLSISNQHDILQRNDKMLAYNQRIKKKKKGKKKVSQLWTNFFF